MMYQGFCLITPISMYIVYHTCHHFFLEFCIVQLLIFLWISYETAFKRKYVRVVNILMITYNKRYGFTLLGKRFNGKGLKDRNMFFDKERQQKKRKEKERRRRAYDRIYSLHERADFLCYINDVYFEKFDGRVSVKLEGLIAKGTGRVSDVYSLYDCEGNHKAEVTMEELYLGNSMVEQLEGGDKKAALYPKEQGISYQAGDILCKL